MKHSTLYTLEAAKFNIRKLSSRWEEGSCWMSGSQDHAELVTRLRSELRRSSDLRKRTGGHGSGPYADHCYIAAEALYHHLGGKPAGITPMNVKVNGDSHWFLRLEDGTFLDPTADQFPGPIPYDRARGRGFLTKEPSKRTQILMERLAWFDLPRQGAAGG